MKTLYRLDIYEDNMGSLIGFYNSLDEIDGNLVQSNTRDGDFVQVTEFNVTDETLNGLEAWTNGDIVNDYYFEYSEF